MCRGLAAFSVINFLGHLSWMVKGELKRLWFSWLYWLCVACTDLEKKYARELFIQFIVIKEGKSEGGDLK